MKQRIEQTAAATAALPTAALATASNAPAAPRAQRSGESTAADTAEVSQRQPNSLSSLCAGSSAGKAQARGTAAAAAMGTGLDFGAVASAAVGTVADAAAASSLPSAWLVHCLSFLPLINLHAACAVSHHWSRAVATMPPLELELEVKRPVYPPELCFWQSGPRVHGVLTRYVRKLQVCALPSLPPPLRIAWPFALRELSIRTSAYQWERFSLATLPNLQGLIDSAADACKQLHTLKLKVGEEPVEVVNAVDLHPLTALPCLSEFLFDRSDTVTDKQMEAIRCMRALAVLSCAMPVEMLARLMRQPGCPPLCRIDFQDTVMTDAHVAALQLPRQLDTWRPRRTEVSNLAFLTGLPALRDVELCFTDCYPSDKAVSAVDDVVVALAHCPHITRLRLPLMEVRSQHITALLPTLPLLEDFDASCGADPHLLRPFGAPGAHRSTLKSLKLMGLLNENDVFPASELQQLYALRGLTQLTLSNLLRPTRALETLRRCMPALKELKFYPIVNEEENQDHEEQQ